MPTTGAAADGDVRTGELPPCNRLLLAALRPAPGKPGVVAPERSWLTFGTDTAHGCLQTASVRSSAPRIAWRLVEAIARLDQPGLSIAELCRRVGVQAETLGLPRPSYEQVRVLANRERRIRAMPGIDDLLVDGLFRVRGPAEVGDVAADRLHERSAARGFVERERAWRPD